MTDSKENEKVEELYFSVENKLLTDTFIEIDSTELGKVDINGAKYTKVSKRLEVLRKKLGFNIRIKTELLTVTDLSVICKTEIFIFKNNEWFPVATGHAEENRSSNEINKVAAVENAETSSIGRALAALGLSGDEYASLEELLTKITKKEGVEDKEVKKEAVSESQINYILKLIKETNSDEAKFLEHFKIKKIQDLSSKEASEAMKLLKGKKDKLKRTATVDPNTKKEQDEALAVLNENKNQSNLTFEKVNVDKKDDIIVEGEVPESSEEVKEESTEVQEVEVKEESTEIKEAGVKEESTKIQETEVKEKLTESPKEAKSTPIKRPQSKRRGRPKKTDVKDEKTASKNGNDLDDDDEITI